jgi:hypothetical protein
MQNWLLHRDWGGIGHQKLDNAESGFINHVHFEEKSLRAGDISLPTKVLPSSFVAPCLPSDLLISFSGYKCVRNLERVLEIAILFSKYIVPCFTSI